MTPGRIVLYVVGWVSLVGLWAVANMWTTLGSWATTGPPFGILQSNGYTDDIPGYAFRTVLAAGVTAAVGIVALNLALATPRLRLRAAVVLTLSYGALAVVVVTAFAPVMALFRPGSWEPSDLSAAQLRDDAVSSIPIVLGVAVLPFVAYVTALIATALRGSLPTTATAVSRAATVLSTVHLILVLVAGDSAISSTFGLAKMEQHGAGQLGLAGIAALAASVLLEVGVALAKRARRRSPRGAVDKSAAELPLDRHTAL